MLKYTVNNNDNLRLDIFLANKLPTLSRAFIQKLSKQEKVLVNKVSVKAGYKLRENDKIEVDYKLSDKNEAPFIDLPVIYEDDNSIVINKPVGILSHGRDAFNDEATVASFIRNKVNGIEGDRAGLVHRLDRVTSGVMLCAKTTTALTWFQRQFASRKVTKTYIAIVAGHLKDEEALIDIPIGRNPKLPSHFRGDSNGKASVTHYKVTKTSEHYSMLELTPKTGRTHQLRVHLSHIGHPIVGDEFYEGQKADRLYLHALSLEIMMPEGEKKIFNAPLPLMFNELIDNDE
jgi:23S rRNA pseudouridine1911/1915/1917 synthase